MFFKKDFRISRFRKKFSMRPQNSHFFGIFRVLTMIKEEFSFKYQTPEMLFVYRDKFFQKNQIFPFLRNFSKMAIPIFIGKNSVKKNTGGDPSREVCVKHIRVHHNPIDRSHSLCHLQIAGQQGNYHYPPVALLSMLRGGIHRRLRQALQE